MYSQTASPSGSSGSASQSAQIMNPKIVVGVLATVVVVRTAWNYSPDWLKEKIYARTRRKRLNEEDEEEAEVQGGVVLVPASSPTAEGGGGGSTRSFRLARGIFTDARAQDAVNDAEDDNDDEDDDDVVVVHEEDALPPGATTAAAAAAALSSSVMSSTSSSWEKPSIVDAGDGEIEILSPTTQRTMEATTTAAAAAATDRSLALPGLNPAAAAAADHDDDDDDMALTRTHTEDAMESQGQEVTLESTAAAAATTTTTTNKTSFDSLSRDEAIELFHKCDVNGTGRLPLSLIDRGIAYHQPRLYNKRALGRAFSAADRNSDGVVSKSEWFKFLQYAQYHASIFEQYASLDENGDGLLSLEEFLKLSERSNSSSASSSSSLLDLDGDDPRQIFDEMDRSGSGFVKFDDFCNWMAIRRPVWKSSVTVTEDGDSDNKTSTASTTTKTKAAEPEAEPEDEDEAEDEAESEQAPLDPSKLRIPSDSHAMQVFDRCDQDGNGIMSLLVIDDVVAQVFPGYSNSAVVRKAYMTTVKSGKNGFVTRETWRDFLALVVRYNNNWDDIASGTSPGTSPTNKNSPVRINKSTSTTARGPGSRIPKFNNRNNGSNSTTPTRSRGDDDESSVTSATSSRSSRSNRSGGGGGGGGIGIGIRRSQKQPSLGRKRDGTNGEGSGSGRGRPSLLSRVGIRKKDSDGGRNSPKPNK